MGKYFEIYVWVPEKMIYLNNNSGGKGLVARNLRTQNSFCASRDSVWASTNCCTYLGCGLRCSLVLCTNSFRWHVMRWVLVILFHPTIYFTLSNSSLMTGSSLLSRLGVCSLGCNGRRQLPTGQSRVGGHYGTTCHYGLRCRKEHSHSIVQCTSQWWQGLDIWEYPKGQRWNSHTALALSGSEISRDSGQLNETLSRSYKIKCTTIFRADVRWRSACIRGILLGGMFI